MASPNLGVLAPPFDLLPGIGGRSKGAGEDMMGSWLESGWLEGFGVSAESSVCWYILREDAKVVAYECSYFGKVSNCCRGFLSRLLDYTVAGALCGSILILRRHAVVRCRCPLVGGWKDEPERVAG
jgi:hypothetical protein